jgi:hypothetical protein
VDLREYAESLYRSAKSPQCELGAEIIDLLDSLAEFDALSDDFAPHSSTLREGLMSLTKARKSLEAVDEALEVRLDCDVDDRLKLINQLATDSLTLRDIRDVLIESGALDRDDESPDYVGLIGVLFA